MFKKAFSFKGRITGAEYGISGLITAVVFISSSIFYALTNNYLTLILVPFGIWFSLSQFVKRNHDLGKSAWYLFGFNFFQLIFKRGVIGQNEYGPDPKE